MFASKLQIRLPRRITAYFLLFGLAALVWLSIGAVYVAHSVTDSRSESASLRWLGRACDRVTLAYLRDKNTDLQSMLAEIRAQSGASYCAIVSPTGEYLAHSNSGHNGKPVAERGGLTDRWGEVMRVEYVDDNGETIHEYRSPLKAGDTQLGTLRLGIAQPSVWTYLRASGAICAAGYYSARRAAWWRARCCSIAWCGRWPTSNSSCFRLPVSPSVEGCELREVPVVGAASLGWNRVVQQRFAVPKADTLRERIRQSLQQGRNSRLDAVFNSIPDGVATTDDDRSHHVHESADGRDPRVEGSGRYRFQGRSSGGIATHDRAACPAVAVGGYR